MSKEIIKKEQKIEELPQAAIEASLKGDWTNVHINHRIAFVRNLCENLGVPLVMNPFLFISVKGKTALYAPASAYQMLGAQKGISTEILSREIDKDLQLYEVFVRSTSKEGVIKDNMAAVTLKGLSGEDYANAKMKCVTKAERRATKSQLGLPIPDEDDLDQRVSDATPLNLVSDEPLASPIIEDEVANWRRKIGELFLGKNSPFHNNPQAASEFVKQSTGKTLQELNAVQLEDLEYEFIKTYYPPQDLDPIEVQLDLEAMTAKKKSEAVL